jgi:ornithine cyclodeaminase/alanine dehydrogenase-like protein (mu-crystallin family)
MVAVVSESTAKRLVGIADAIAVSEAAFASLARGESLLFPAVRGHGSDPATRFGVKSGYDGVRRLPGLKVGTYWPGNVGLGLGNHGSTTLLLDDDTGYVQGIVAATYLTALRTAAADAVAVKYLAREDARVLALVGTGHQAYYDALAVSQVRDLRRVLVCGRRADAAEALAQRLREAGVPAVSTVTASRAPLIAAGLLRPGTHVSAMGADGPGKQELAIELVAGASLWADAPQQSVAMGEFQHAAAAGLIETSAIGAIGNLIAGQVHDRSADQITIFDSSGIALQDLAICAFALERARAAGLASEVDFG